MVVVAPVPRTWSVTPDVRAKDSRACSTSWVGSAPIRSARNGQVDDGVRTAADVDDGGRERFVHRDDRLAEPDDPGAVAQRLAERGAQDEGHVLGGVVLVDARGRRTPGRRGRRGRGSASEVRR